MTSQVSLTVNKKAGARSPWVHSFWEAVRDSFALPILSTLVYLVVIVGTLMMMKSAYNDPNNLAQFNTAFQYYFFDGDEQLKYVLPVLIFGLAVMQGVFTFRFLFSRKAVNVWFGMGVSRRQLFSSRLLGGAIKTVLPLAVALTVSLGINLAAFSDTGLILGQFFRLLLGLGAQALSIYAITAAVCSCVGTWIEGALYSAIVVAAPTGILFSLNELMIRFLLGNCFDVNTYSNIQPRQAIYNSLASFNPLMFFYRSTATLASRRNPLVGTLQPVSMLSALGWLIATLVIAWLAWRIFHARKVEITGVMGKSGKLAFGCILIVAFFAFSLPLAAASRINTAWSPITSIVIASALFLLLALLMALPLRLIGRPRWKSLMVPLAGLAAVFALIGILYAGGLGYSGYVPRSDDIAKVAISYKGLPTFAPKETTWDPILVGTGEFEASIMLDDEKDFTTAIAIHHALIDAGHLSLQSKGDTPSGLVMYGDVHITYTLKSGAIVARDYDRATMETLKKMLALDNTTGARQTFQDVLNGKFINNRGYVNSNNFKNGFVYISGKLYSGLHRLVLDEQQRIELINCISKDVAGESLEGRYFPTKQPPCILIFSTEEFSLDIGMNYQQTKVFVTNEYKNTLEFLQRNNLLSGLASPKVEWIKAVRFDSMVLAEQLTFDSKLSPVFYDSEELSDIILQNLCIAPFKDATFKDEQSIKALLDSCYGQYHCLDGGYVLYCKLAGGNNVITAFVPEAQAPEFLKTSLK